MRRGRSRRWRRLREGEPFYVKAHICNEHRAVGARLAGELALLRAKGELGRGWM